MAWGDHLIFALALSTKKVK
jgi:hypothetical protein